MRIKQNVCSKLWTDTNIDFRRQTLRHCCKQDPHDITLDEINELGVDVFEKYPLHLDNKNKMLFDNKIPDSCNFCKLNNEHSIRHSWNTWSDDFINENRPQLLKQDLTNYFEIDMGDKCDLACVYCGPQSSTTWQKELGWPSQRENSEKIQWRETMMNLLEQRLTQGIETLGGITINFLGGEPTLIPDTYKILDKLLPILKQYKHKPNILFTTNLNTKSTLMDRFVNTMESTKEYVNWSVGVSIEDVNERAELVRYGLDFNRFTKNLVRIAPHCKVYFTCTQNFLSMPYFGDIVEYMFNTMPTVYKDDWGITANCVYDNALDPAYLDHDMVDWRGIENILTKYNVQSDIIDHMNNMEARAGTKTPDDKFMQTYQLLLKRSEKYLELFPHLKTKLG